MDKDFRAALTAMEGRLMTAINSNHEQVLLQFSAIEARLTTIEARLAGLSTLLREIVATAEGMRRG